VYNYSNNPLKNIPALVPRGSLEPSVKTLTVPSGIRASEGLLLYPMFNRSVIHLGRNMARCSCTLHEFRSPCDVILFCNFSFKGVRQRFRAWRTLARRMERPMIWLLVMFSLSVIDHCDCWPTPYVSSYTWGEFYTHIASIKQKSKLAGISLT